ncbi:MAG TPA: aldolase/citrate lyase family protein [Verrucomicrobiales bacterium]|nr:aldolase/citrate lyase family protein [Verrucomicrobiales bacterium]
MEAARLLRQKIHSDEVTTGVLATFHFWPGLVEVAMNAGLDYLIIDLEHLTHDAEKVAEACAIGRRANFPVLIRPPAAEFTPMRLAMDLGPCGLLVPYVESLDTMRAIEEAVFLKPRGRRRPGGPGNAWVNDYHYETWRTTVEDHLIILPQIESRAGLDQVEAIAAHPLTTAIAVGPYDLSADLGVCWKPDSPEMQEALGRIRAAGKSVGKNMWMIGDGAALAGQGYTFLCIGEPVMMLQARLGELNAVTKAAKS